MGTSGESLKQGTTLAWTEGYGTPLSSRAKAAEVVRDLLFAAGLLVLLVGTAGFVAYDGPAPQASYAGEVVRAL